MFDALLATIGTLGALASIMAGLRAAAAVKTDENAAPEDEAAPSAIHAARSRRRGRGRGSRLQCASRTGKGLRSSR